VLLLNAINLVCIKRDTPTNYEVYDEKNIIHIFDGDQLDIHVDYTQDAYENIQIQIINVNHEKYCGYLPIKEYELKSQEKMMKIVDTINKCAEKELISSSRSKRLFN